MKKKFPVACFMPWMYAVPLSGNRSSSAKVTRINALFFLSVFKTYLGLIFSLLVVEAEPEKTD